MEDEIWLTTREAAELAGVSVVTVYSWVRRGHLEVEGLDHRGQKPFRHLDVARAEKTTRSRAAQRGFTSRTGLDNRAKVDHRRFPPVKQENQRRSDPSSHGSVTA
ncbi:helix-turn-helix domain-containing protein [Streptomyces sp. EMB26]